MRFTRHTSTWRAPRHHGTAGWARRGPRLLVAATLLAALIPVTAPTAWGLATGAAGGSSAPSASPQAGGTNAQSPTGSRTGSHASTPKGTGGAESHSSTRQPAPITVAGARCVPQSACSTRWHWVSAGGYLQLEGSNLVPGMVVAFPRSRNARISRLSPVAKLSRTKLGLTVQVPSNAHSGRIVVRAGNRHSNSFGPLTVVAYSLHPPRPKAAPPISITPTGPTAFNDQGMWIWYLSRSDGGSLSAIAAQAKAAGVGTVYVKSSDGSSNYWSQFSPSLVSGLHAAGLKVCAWQYVYGTNPVGEANLGAEAVADGADCLVIDAEAEYEGHYAAAQLYLETLRAKIGPSYPLGLASFPYVDYHESFPYSVFLGPGGAQFNLPQMYWKDIGTSVANIYIHSFEENLVYGRPICPLGQTFEAPSVAEIVQFRSLAGPYNSCGTSYWDWQETSSAGWSALAAPLTPGVTVPQPELTSPLLHQGARGDQVLWLQEHLAGYESSQPTNGIFEATTTANLKAFQTAHGVSASGETDPTTWADVLALTPVAVHWTGSGPPG